MNTPRSRPIVRFPNPRGKPRIPTMPAGRHIGELTPPAFQQVLGRIVARWAHLEEMMITFMSFLLGDDLMPPARQIFRSVYGTQARIAIMRSLLEEAHINKSKGPEYDEIIDEFESLTKERNNYVHGLWWTNEDTGAVLRSDPNITSDVGTFLDAKPVAIKQGEHVLTRMDILFGRIIRMMGKRVEEKERLAKPPPPSDKAD
jgi:hypothetical protein